MEKNAATYFSVLGLYLRYEWNAYSFWQVKVQETGD